MRVTIKLYTSLFQEGRFASEERDLPEETQVWEVIESLQIKPSETMVFVNGKHVKKNYILCDGDCLALMPPMRGG